MRLTTVGTQGLIDDLRYSYTDAARPGRLTRVSENYSPRMRGYRVSNGPYPYSNVSYDAAGNMLSLAGGRQQFAYDAPVGRPSRVTVDGVVTKYDQLLTGATVRTQTGAAAGSVRTAFVGPVEFVNGRAERVMVGGGYYDVAAARWVFQATDYLGTPRVSFSDLDGDGRISYPGDVLEERTVDAFGQYAFGWARPGSLTDEGGFTGHARVGVGRTGRTPTADGAGWAYSMVDMEARVYVPALGVFAAVDPLADHPNQVFRSPYAYAWNDPVNLTDPDGQCPACWGALAGFVVDVGIQVAVNLSSGQSLNTAIDNVDLKQSFVALGTGAASGGLSAVKTLHAVTKGSLSLAVNGTGSAASQAAKTGKVDAGEVAIDAVGGEVASRVLGPVVKAAVKMTPAGAATAKQLATQVRRTENTAANRATIAASGGRARPAQAARAVEARGNQNAQGATAGVGGGVAASEAASDLVNKDEKKQNR